MRPRDVLRGDARSLTLEAIGRRWKECKSADADVRAGTGGWLPHLVRIHALGAIACVAAASAHQSHLLSLARLQRAVLPKAASDCSCSILAAAAERSGRRDRAVAVCVADVAGALSVLAKPGVSEAMS